jgi:hypothetical protein
MLPRRFAGHTTVARTMGSNVAAMSAGSGQCSAVFTVTCTKSKMRRGASPQHTHAHRVLQRIIILLKQWRQGRFRILLRVAESRLFRDLRLRLLGNNHL